ELDRAVAERSSFAKTLPTPVTVKLIAELDGGEGAGVDLTRRFMKNGITRTEVRDDGLVASYFCNQDAPRPGVILFGGSGGGLAEEMPALLASRGFAVLSLAYFGMAGVPQYLIDIPLEYFARAIAWMKRQPTVKQGKLAVSGASRGGELALLLGATFTEITAVLAYVPSGVVWPGLGASENPNPPSWTWRGEPIPAVKTTPMSPEVWSKPPVAITPWFLESMANNPSMDRATIAVEKINGAVLMFSGTDDAMWPSLRLADIAQQRFIAKGFKHPYEHVTYAGAGHMFRFPYSPVMSEIYHPVARQLMALGGTPLGNHAASLDSWQRSLAFLHKQLD
ncbi:MAG: acyl-CoA thioester hydrolase/BAAT C-terminal domain-containing protein, partial [Candidatus Binataceae bacterium]